MRQFAVEMDKVLRRKETYIFLLVFFFIPLFFSYQISTNSGVVSLHSQTSSISIFELIELYLGFITSLFLPFIAVAGFTTSTVSREIEEGSIKLYISHSKSRLSLYLAKCLSIASIMFILYLLFCISSYLGLLMFEHKKISFNYNVEAMESFFKMFACSYVATIVLALIGFCFSLFIGVTGTYAGMLGLVIISKILELSNVSKEYLLTFLSDATKVTDINKAISILKTPINKKRSPPSLWN
ncbi:hypothetical protein GT50_18370 [Geobacillus stearothermophilus 10]|nr:hypothetical protein GT50_18370 [Geobacillus stearothermophilus 10]